ncbi:MAG: hypothetical protein KM310_10560 [Clostridiales bacterium]|nr:hypothetical protein [Clostridiales bacterium]
MALNKKLTLRLDDADLSLLDAVRLPAEARSTAAARLLRESLQAPQRYAEILARLERIERLLQQGVRFGRVEEVPQANPGDLGVDGLLDAFEFED